MNSSPALIITYNPQPDFYKRLAYFYDKLVQIIIVDNGSNQETRYLLEQEVQHRKSSLKVIFNEKNLGVATALNQGFQWAIDRGYKQIFAFDQDSSPSPGTISALQKNYGIYSNRYPLAIVTSVPRDLQVNVQARFLRPTKGFF